MDWFIDVIWLIVGMLAWLVDWLTESIDWLFDWLILIDWLIHSSMHSCIHLFVRSFNHSSIHSCMHAFIPFHSFPSHPIPFHSFMHAFIDSFSHSFIHSFIHWFMHSYIHWFIDSLIQSFIGCLAVTLSLADRIFSRIPSWLVSKRNSAIYPLWLLTWVCFDHSMPSCAVHMWLCPLQVPLDRIMEIFRYFLGMTEQDERDSCSRLLASLVCCLVQLQLARQLACRLFWRACLPKWDMWDGQYGACAMCMRSIRCVLAMRALLCVCASLAWCVRSTHDSCARCVASAPWKVRLGYVRGMRAACVAQCVVHARCIGSIASGRMMRGVVRLRSVHNARMWTSVRACMHVM